MSAERLSHKHRMNSNMPKYLVYEERGVLHRIPANAFRYTACDIMTGIMFEKMTLEKVLKHKKLCRDCWENTKARTALAINDEAHPKRIQRKRSKGWRMPDNTVYVGRPTKWGNPFVVGKVVDNIKTMDVKHSINRYRYYLTNQFMHPNPLGHLSELRGKHLACWCKEGEPCHADILIELANSAKPRKTGQR